MNAYPNAVLAFQGMQVLHKRANRGIPLCLRIRIRDVGRLRQFLRADDANRLQQADLRLAQKLGALPVRLHNIEAATVQQKHASVATHGASCPQHGARRAQCVRPYVRGADQSKHGRP